MLKERVAITKYAIKWAIYINDSHNGNSTHRLDKIVNIEKKKKKGVKP